jgi:acetyl-CoA carboxylase biotin carboxylase subunit
VAAGARISGRNYTPKLYAMECRINAEDPANGFRPSPGKITNLHFPGGHGVRIDSHVYSGYTIPPNYDSMIAKLIVSGQSREEVITRMKRALQEFVIEGIKTTIPFHIKLMDDATFRSGQFTTAFLETFDFSKL